MEDIQNTIRRKSLGRIEEIGSLYNATIDTFCGINILNKEKWPNGSIKKTKIFQPNILCGYENTYKEKFKMLDVEAELKLSIIAELFSWKGLKGSIEYLTDVKESFKSVKSNLIYKITSFEENLDIYRDDVKACISTDEFSNNHATHVIIGIKWGASIIASIECSNVKEEEKSQVEEGLKAYCENLSVSISKKSFKNVKEPNLGTHFSIKLFGDIPHNKQLPQSFNEARKIIIGLPSYIKKLNNGKGVPIEYILYPISDLADLFAQNTNVNFMETSLSEATILKVEQMFDNLSEFKQRLNDLFNDTNEAQIILPDLTPVFNEIKDRMQEVRNEKVRFVNELTEYLIKIRFSNEDTDELESKIETFQKGNLSKSSIMEFIKKHRSVSIRAGLALAIKSKKVEKIDKNLTIDEHILLKYPNNEIYILIDSDEHNIDDKSFPIYSMFRDLYNSDELSKYCLKIFTGKECSKYPVIQHYINGKLNSDNYYDDSKVLFTSNVVKFDPVPSKPKNTPNKKTQLVMPCPQDCPIVDCNWRCLKCEQNIKYGYNKRLYCDCGESDVTHCKFRCNSSHHTRGYVPFESDTLIKVLPSASPEEINILLLGETGVGKSTFINAFVNYLKFDSLSDAKSRNMRVFIPSKFTVTDENCEMKTIKLGDDDSNERLGSVGESSTIWCKSYVFHAPGNKHIRLIDTPGIGDTRGLNEDKKNFEKIMISISKYKFLNGICILLKPNNPRLNIVFRFCVQELLSHLHKSAKDNIVFCFTNARGTFYRPGDTLPSLKKQIDELKERSNVEINIDKDTTYCFDNESFRFLAALKEGIAFTETDELCFAESWKKSVNESRRLIEHISGCKPHQVEDTISLNNARSIVMLLSKPLAEVGQLIQTNIKLIKEKQSEIENSDKTIEDLKDQLYIPQIDLEPIQLGYPRTVCTNGSCDRTLKINETTIKIDYIQHCCKRCYVPFNNYLKLCWAMKFDGTCKECGCERNKHMHISYENKQIINNIVNEDVNSEILKNKSDQDAKKAMIKECEERLTQLKGEQNIINEISIKFAQFLRQNAIASFNDAYAEYLDLFVNEEKIKKSADPRNYDDEILKGLEDTKKSYLDQIDLINQAISNDDTCPISPKDISDLEQRLYALPINGQTLKKINDEVKRSRINDFKESHYIPLENSMGKNGNSLYKLLGKFSKKYFY
ncbi:uncharacterized protein OCT59_002347 [Rhizophagus irregularis]|uniref:Uncharacterized protein n=1 Tax=Rhizophagus irregularis (strain DAOM 181602 / DAOM 197198 / MUCL 43194) TaxID=747089 RepID=U9UTS6_RHIID|nr:hypothetical protein GLOIN_2v1885271 [Rhizophagus irregularis DAOM 181602=DAOM 197198]POG59161.1 hypothetical protein GLOIN_2v1885271 [Rhizophagus irregularis DAOM 181602=DAOM 197198]UZO10769.1 hypothetical protein OCT59_002347 [Rhizophagus irregularis]GBC46985.1 hypothetical protein GLOIN_2v1885271 [Rhizophagus irregularis DAOM 181602=DAOM 197198]CAG8546467.1 22888_t:CDS:1 [Rhizophagus irregularis]|eukprot:XP_025166027.1 hypothetical protein GLOIN_2v1885271 [Rhizophagus irregularis DAOM 181602=DAOM 197198]